MADTSAQTASLSDSRRRKPREKKRKSKKEKEREHNATSAPASGNSALSAIDTKPPISTTAPPAIVQQAELGDDFVPFDLSEPEDEPAPPPPPQREWDEGKRSSRRDSPEPGRDRDRRRAKGKESSGGEVFSRRAPWVHDVDWEACTNVAEMLHKEVQAFIDYISPTEIEHEVRGLVIKLISDVVTKQFPDAKVMPFGSFETKLYLPLGDIDLVIQSDQMAYSDRVRVLHALANCMRRADIAEKVTVIAKAKVPIIKFITKIGRFAVDISINQLNGVAAGRMVNRFIQELPALRALVLVTKSFLSQRSMNEVFTGGLGSYSIVCLAASFLQMHPKIRRGEIDPAKNLGVLVMEFFELYGLYFNYRDVGISLRDGGTYYNKGRRGWADFKNDALLSIEDPADPANDISKGSYNIMRVRQTLAGAHGIMTAAAYQRAETISARRSGRYISFRQNNTNPEEWSILMSVMGVTQETLNHRRLVLEVYDKGILHQAAGVPPPARSKNKDKTTRSSKRSRSRSRSPKPGTAETGVKAVWIADADEDAETSHKRKRSPADRKDEKDHEEEEEEESRYGIVKDGGPPAKRRRTGGELDIHTVFTTDDEDEEGAIYEHTSDSEVDEVDRAQAAAQEALGSSSRSKDDKSKTRSYWLSKGVGPEMASDSEYSYGDQD